ncbi:MAG: hypothetical protein QY323_01365 [Patescibacteria group bacterium]|nr:MAG: hypothetical protein QY323_01365 [Patescibacteria group bacterium]
MNLTVAAQDAGVFIAIVSLGLSIYAISKDRQNKKIDRLLESRQRLFSIQESAEALTPDEMQEHFEDNPHSYEAEKHRAASREITLRTDREFEFLCYMVVKNQVPTDMFIDLFAKWLTFRFTSWSTIQKHKIHNYPYTWRVVQEHGDKGK